MNENVPSLWLADLPRPKADGHKYDRGHAVIAGAPELTGATRLAAEACARIGAGLVTVAGGAKADIYRASLPGHILVRDRMPGDLKTVTAMLIGPGGMPESYKISPDIPLVADADAIGVIKELPRISVLTPHEGEFARAFPALSGTREERAQAAARDSGAVVVLKGPETVIAGPDGQGVVNLHATPYLATAGTGDVLAGMITGLLAQGMDPFRAACAAVWIHGEAGRRLGPGLVASDLPGLVPGVLKDLL